MVGAHRRRPLRPQASHECVVAMSVATLWCVVPAAGVAGEAMMALVLAEAFLEKFGGDSLTETQRNFEGYKKQLDQF